MRPGFAIYPVLRRMLRNDQLVLLVVALVVGTVSAYGAVAFRELYHAIQLFSFGTYSDFLYRLLGQLPAWRVVAVPVVGGLLIGLWVRFVMPAGRAEGVPEVMEATALRSGRMTARATLGAAVASAASIGVGASVGREGPVVHLGAGLGSILAERLGFSRSQVVTLLGCGVASAIAASFNVPIAGAFFALEVVVGHYALNAFAPIVVASVIGAIVSRVHYGNFPAFIVPAHSGVSALEFPAFVVLGMVCAIAAVLFLRAIPVVERAAERAPGPCWGRPMVAGLLVGLIGLAWPEIMGVGYGSVDAALKGQLSLDLLVALTVAKTAATAISLGAGFSGGIFSPSLFVGAMVGGAFGVIVTDAFPALSSGPGAYTLVGMGAVAGPVLGAPVSTILIVFELTGDYALTIAVMVAVVISSVIVQQAGVASYFVGQLDRRGINLRGGREVSLLRAISVGEVMRDAYVAVRMDTPMSELREKLRQPPYGPLLVVDERGALRGTITLADLSDAAFDTTHDALLNAVDAARGHPPTLEHGDDLARALELMESMAEERIAVVDGKAGMRPVGLVHLVDVMNAYNRALLRTRREERGED